MVDLASAGRKASILQPAHHPLVIGHAVSIFFTARALRGSDCTVTADQLLVRGASVRDGDSLLAHRKCAAAAASCCRHRRRGCITHTKVAGRCCAICHTAALGIIIRYGLGLCIGAVSATHPGSKANAHSHAPVTTLLLLLLLVKPRAGRSFRRPICINSLWYLAPSSWWRCIGCMEGCRLWLWIRLGCREKLLRSRIDGTVPGSHVLSLGHLRVFQARGDNCTQTISTGGPMVAYQRHVDVSSLNLLVVRWVVQYGTGIRSRPARKHNRTTGRPESRQTHAHLSTPTHTTAKYASLGASGSTITE
jgi:hypothetical protein